LKMANCVALPLRFATETVQATGVYGESCVNQYHEDSLALRCENARYRLDTFWATCKCLTCQFVPPTKPNLYNQNIVDVLSHQD
jgi:hypothetical protein